MGIKLAEVSYIRRSMAEVTVLRELISERRSKQNRTSEYYLLVICRMHEKQLRSILGRPAKSGLISYNISESDTDSHVNYNLHFSRIQELIEEGKEFVFRALREISEIKRRKKQTMLEDKSRTDIDGEAKGVITQVPEASATNHKAEDATAAKDEIDKC